MRKKYLEKNISLGLRQKVIDDLRLILTYNIIMKYQKTTNLLDDTTNQPCIQNKKLG